MGHTCVGRVWGWGLKSPRCSLTSGPSGTTLSLQGGFEGEGVQGPGQEWGPGDGTKHQCYFLLLGTGTSLNNSTATHPHTPLPLGWLPHGVPRAIRTPGTSPRPLQTARELGRLLSAAAQEQPPQNQQAVSPPWAEPHWKQRCRGGAGEVGAWHLPTAGTTPPPVPQAVTLLALGWVRSGGREENFHRETVPLSHVSPPWHEESRPPRPPRERSRLEGLVPSAPRPVLPMGPPSACSTTRPGPLWQLPLGTVFHFPRRWPLSSLGPQTLTGCCLEPRDLSAPRHPLPSPHSPEPRVAAGAGEGFQIVIPN